MALIDNEEAARRLARVILSDIELYQQKRIEAGDDMSGDLAEGRALFGRRVAPQLLPIFDATLATRRLGGRATNLPIPPMPVAVAAVPTVAPTPPPPSAAPAPPPEAPPSDPPPPEPSPAAEPSLSAEVATMVTMATTATTATTETTAEVDAEMSQAETGRSVVTAEIAESMMAEGSGKDPAAPALEAPPPPAVSEAAAVPEAKLASDDRATPVPVEDIVSRPPEARAADGPPEPPRDEPAPPEATEAAEEEDRITARGMAVFTEPEAEPIKLPAPPTVATPPAPIPTPPPIPAAARGGTPRPVLLAQKPAEGTREPPAKTPQPLLPPTVSPGQSSAGVRVGTPAGSPRVATPFRSSAFQPLNLPPMPEAAAVAAPVAAAPAESPAAAPDDVVNLRKKTPKVVVLLVILAVIGGVMLIGSFLTRFL